MDKLEQKHKQLIQALGSLDSVLLLFRKMKQGRVSPPLSIEAEETYRVYRDAVIQRFEYSIDLFWKFIKKYLESVHLLPNITVPREVIRAAYSANVLSEIEAEMVLEMIKSRNLTSHLYLEDFAEQLVAQIPSYYDSLQKIVLRMNAMSEAETPPARG